jgi:hypothetical protein
MKSFGLLKMAVTLAGFGAVLVLTPSCRAQSEINPDHFDGSDSWEVAARTPAPHAVTWRASRNQQAQNKQAQSKPASASSTFQLAAERKSSAPQRPDAVAIQDKRKAAVRKPEKQ